MPRLFSTHTVTFTRQTGDGYHDEVSGDWVSVTDPSFDATGSLQPYRSGYEQVILPEGVNDSDAKIFYTKTEIRTANKTAGTLADTATINSEEYEVFSSEDWTGFGSAAGHYRGILILKKRVIAGGI